MTSFDDLLKFSNSMSLKRPEDVDPMAAAIWHSLIEDYYSGLNQRFNDGYAEQAAAYAENILQPPGITMRTMNLKTVPLDYGECE